LPLDKLQALCYDILSMKDKDIFTALSETNYLLGKITGALFVIEVLLQNSKDLFESDPLEAKKYLDDALAKIRQIRKGKKIICPSCHQELTKKADIEWFNQFGECLLCDHIASDK